MGEWMDEIKRDGFTYRLFYDECGECPAEWLGDSCALVVFESDRGVSFGCNHNIEEVKDLVAEVSYRYDADKVGDALLKHYARKGWDACLCDLGGWYSGCARAVVAVDEEGGYGSAKSLADEVGRWSRGEVYQITKYAPHVWHDEDGNTMTTLDAVDSLGGLYLDNGYSFWDAIEDNF